MESAEGVDDAVGAEMRAYADELRASFLRLQEEAPALHEKARAVQVTEKSEDGLISATVGARGDLVRLDIDPRVYRRPDSRRLADAITETVHRAADKARARVVEVFDPIIPADQMRAHLDGDLQRVLDDMAARMLGKK
ncbi:YbaB/EbfC family DNA-binding protein [Sphaerisporangium album]|uniref:YbaB/EbfC family DNA-binding protein n=1 Tax=Sphaerisporangium album TaxID=509200 RepID=A0A367FSI9_9ACTN|nr:YbaB/EbfC family nucleoid-associated protein [Sphaerisporangium album]RCG32647.1 YbaB/EbfC family DNA-binding protein [Sphaerisporangium album]